MKARQDALVGRSRGENASPVAVETGAVSDAAGTLRRLLVENILPFWYPGTLDRERGGYRLHHDAAGVWKGPAPRRLVAQARTLWFFSRLYRSPYGEADHLEAARHGYVFLRDVLWDRRHGGFFWEVEADGDRPTVAGKHLYAQAFGLYALAEFARSSKEDEALDLARRLLRLLESRAHDRPNAGYRESFRRDWSTPPETDLGALKAAPSRKLVNTHLHLMEAMIGCVRAGVDPVARDRLLELVHILAETAPDPDTGLCRDVFRRDWSPDEGVAGDRALVSYGHELERVWLLQDGHEALGLPHDRRMAHYRGVFARLVRHGFDRRKGGFYRAGPPGGPAVAREKVWWVQAEGLVAALRMYDLTGRNGYLRCFTKTLEWIERHQADRERGEWHAMIDPRGRPMGNKAGPWKGPYHTGRAALECLDLLASSR